jgi:hypothetical protein
MWRLVVMAGPVPAIHVFDPASPGAGTSMRQETQRRGWPAQGRP